MRVWPVGRNADLDGGPICREKPDSELRAPAGQSARAMGGSSFAAEQQMMPVAITIRPKIARAADTVAGDPATVRTTRRFLFADQRAAGRHFLAVPCESGVVDREQPVDCLRGISADLGPVVFQAFQDCVCGLLVSRPRSALTCHGCRARRLCRCAQPRPVVNKNDRCFRTH
jgi:hypothetical protein